PGPVQREEPIHQARVQHVEVLRPETTRHDVEDVAIERRWFVVFGHASLRIAPRELPRIHLIPDLDVARGDALIPRAHSAARHGNDATRVDMKRHPQPVEEWHPVQRFEPHFREPWTCAEQTIAIDDGLDLALDAPFSAIE